MLIAEEPALRAITFTKHDVSDRLETPAAPCLEERIDLRPSVEHHGYPVLLQYAIRFCHRRLQPGAIGIILDRAPCAVAVVHEIWRIGEDEIDAVRGPVSGRWKSMGQRSEIRLASAKPDQTGVVETQQSVALDYCLRWNNASQKVIIDAIF